jgi:hypothetical protein
MRAIALTAAAVLASGCASVHETAHTGFHFHADLGAVGTGSSATSQGTTAKVSGGGVGGAVSIGGALAPNLILGAETWGSSVFNPTISVGGSSDTAVDVTYDVSGLGPKITYYVMPANLYLSATPSFTRLTLTDTVTGDRSRTDWGFGLRAALGKEWWVGERWGIGLAGVLQYSSNKDSDGGPTWSTLGGGLVFSASYN